MWGVRREDRVRWDEAAERASKAEQKMNDHIQECSRNYQKLDKAVDELAEVNKWQTRYVLTGLVMIVLWFLAEILAPHLRFG